VFITYPAGQNGDVQFGLKKQFAADHTLNYSTTTHTLSAPHFTGDGSSLTGVNGLTVPSTFTWTLPYGFSASTGVFTSSVTVAKLLSGTTFQFSSGTVTGDLSIGGDFSISGHRAIDRYGVIYYPSGHAFADSSSIYYPTGELLASHDNGIFGPSATIAGGTNDLLPLSVTGNNFNDSGFDSGGAADTVATFYGQDNKGSYGGVPQKVMQFASIGNSYGFGILPVFHLFSGDGTGDPANYWVMKFWNLDTMSARGLYQVYQLANPLNETSLGLNFYDYGGSSIMMANWFEGPGGTTANFNGNIGNFNGSLNLQANTYGDTDVWGILNARSTLRALGPVDESVMGYDRVDLGAGSGTARAIFETGSNIWEIDNDGTDLRFYIPGVVQMRLHTDGSGNSSLGLYNSAAVEKVHLDSNGTNTFGNSTTFTQVSASTLTVSNQIYNPSYTLAQIKLLTPGQAGAQVYCSNCATDNIVIATGTAKGAWSRAGARTTAPQ
jgi:hypothetical protein